ncbi:DUF6227 family protein [Streptomyces diacarni]|uniref:Uncharacterized protein n=1 Tax=Streptomyces diacarni TaxID=2800381 RepID=A0A367EU22_9ACTN|nr:DUF6227 family protein [Streptomyces diacarni]RCG21521.1 hypothetical protein DTL70_19120 [Streptomyces diacarni]
MSEEAHLTPAHHLHELLARAQNPFDVPDAVLHRLRDAVMFQVELYGWRHRNSPPPALRCSSFRHVFLLADGASVLLWELCYDGPEGAGELHEVYDDAEALARSERRVHRQMGEAHTPDASFGITRTSFDSPPGRPGAEVFPAREYVRGGSAEHARRLLRRAENPDRPGEETLRQLATALGHHITHVPKPHAHPGGPGEGQVWCAVYEHAFLLADGYEVSLYELEHNMTAGGRLVCEVYLEESVADQAAHRLGRGRGLDL